MEDDDSCSFMSAQWVFSGVSPESKASFVCRFVPPTTETVFVKYIPTDTDEFDIEFYFKKKIFLSCDPLKEKNEKHWLCK